MWHARNTTRPIVARDLFAKSMPSSGQSFAGLRASKTAIHAHRLVFNNVLANAKGAAQKAAPSLSAGRERD
jgi:hypothetical protein